MIKLLLAALMVGCVSKATARPTSTLPPAPAPTATRQAMTDDVAGRLSVRHAASSPEIDGQVDALWMPVEPLRLPLTWGIDGTEHALDLELRALRTGEAIYFLAQWPGEPPPGEENVIFNKLTVHWRIPDAAVRRLDCSVACHTAHANSQGRFVYANAETIPQGGDEALSAAGGWRAGVWTLEWSRPLVNSNPFDLQFNDPQGIYLFSVKVFEPVEGRADLVSRLHQLSFDDRVH